MVLGEIGVARVNPYDFGQGQPPVHSAWFLPRRLTVVTQLWGAIQEPPLSRWTSSTSPGLRMASGEGGDFWRGQKRDQLWGNLKANIQYDIQ